MSDYYSDKLSAQRLRRCYEIAPPRVQRYLAAEIDFVRERLEPGARVLELGCGYGRVLAALAGIDGGAVGEPVAPAIKPVTLIGVDSSLASLLEARKLLSGAEEQVTSAREPLPGERGETPGAREPLPELRGSLPGAPCRLARMDALRLGLRDAAFDLVFCIQNGMAAFGVDRGELLAETLRVTRPGGRVLFSSYAARFWEQRLEWFRLQSAAGLLGEIDEEATGDGTIVCRDGFRAGTVSPDEFAALAAAQGIAPAISELDGSSVFCELRAP